MRVKVAAAKNSPLERLNLISGCGLMSLLIAFFFLVIQNLMRKVLQIVLWTGRRRVAIAIKSQS